MEEEKKGIFARIKSFFVDSKTELKKLFGQLKRQYSKIPE